MGYMFLIMQMESINYGDILWLKLPQSLAPIDVALDQPHKTRPFIVLAPLKIAVDHNGFATQERSIFGVDCTTQKHIIANRPCIEFSLRTNPDKITYALLDSVRDINSYDQKIKKADQVPQEQLEHLRAGLDGVLCPEQKFFLKAIFNKGRHILPGQIRRIKTINADGEALVLFRRGKFVMDDAVETSDDIDLSCQKARHTPYLVAYFPRHKNVQTPRGIGWGDIQIMAVQERDIHEQTAKFTDETVGNIINQVRRRASLQPILYKQPLFRHVFSMGPLMTLPRLG